MIRRRCRRRAACCQVACRRRAARRCQVACRHRVACRRRAAGRPKSDVDKLRAAAKLLAVTVELRVAAESHADKLRAAKSLAATGPRVAAATRAVARSLAAEESRAAAKPRVVTVELRVTAATHADKLRTAAKSRVAAKPHDAKLRIAVDPRAASDSRAAGDPHDGDPHPAAESCAMVAFTDPNALDCRRWGPQTLPSDIQALAGCRHSIHVRGHGSESGLQLGISSPLGSANATIANKRRCSSTGICSHGSESGLQLEESSRLSSANATLAQIGDSALGAAGSPTGAALSGHGAQLRDGRGTQRHNGRDGSTAVVSCCGIARAEACGQGIQGVDRR